MKYIPNIQVIIKDLIEFFIFFFIISLWVQVMEIPDLTKMMVFNNGTFIGLNKEMFLGGHSIPISMFGEMLEWKYDQKKEKKNITSETMNKIIPIFNPFEIMKKCEPCLVVSEIMLVHHENVNVIVNII